MIEKDIEQKIAESIDEKLEQAGVSRWQTICAWGTSKQTESKEADVYVTVKVHPRQYETYTTPVAAFSIDVTLIARADADYDGKTYLDIADAVLGLLHSWQTSIDSTCEQFDLEGFSTAGFRMDGGDVVLQQDTKVWSCT